MDCRVVRVISVEEWMKLDATELRARRIEQGSGGVDGGNTPGVGPDQAV
jgi:hypothetical protein